MVLLKRLLILCVGVAGVQAIRSNSATAFEVKCPDIFASTIHAGLSAHESALQISREFELLGTYEPFVASANVFDVLKVAEGRGEDLNHIEVLYITPIDASEPGRIVSLYDMEDLQPLQARDGAKRFMMHAVVNYKGVIIDPDFMNDTAVSEVGSYFWRMFGAGQSATSQLGLQVIPAKDYLSKFGEDPHSAFNVHFFRRAQDTYPIMSIKDFFGNEI